MKKKKTSKSIRGRKYFFKKISVVKLAVELIINYGADNMENIYTNAHLWSFKKIK